MKNNHQLPPINNKLYEKQAARFLVETLKKAGHKKVVVAVSGGVDSAVTLTLCIRALGAENVIVAMLPCGPISKKSLTRSKELVTKLKIPNENIHTVDISPAVDACAAHSLSTTKHRRGNIMARVRMIVVYDIARANKALVVGTENKSEHLLGYFTRFGDEASDIELVRGLYKTQVFMLAKHLEIPASTQKAEPSAELWDGQSDKEQLTFSYEDADPILYLFHDKKTTSKQMIEKGCSEGLVGCVVRRVRENEFKHTTPHAFVFHRTRSS